MKTFWRKWSLRTQLVSAQVASLCAVLLVFAAGVYGLFRHDLIESLHRELGREFEVVESSIDVAADGTLHWRGDDDHVEAHYEGGRIAAEVWDSSGKLLVRTRGAERWAPQLASSSPDPHAEGFDVVQLGNERVQVLQGRHTTLGHTFLIRVYRSARPIHEITTTLAWTLLLALIAALLLAVGTSRRIVTRLFLQPLGRMIERARLISGERSDERLPISNPDDELGQLARVINEAFSRFDQAVFRLRRFTADASHELRTPLTNIRSVGEMCLRGEPSESACRDAIGSMLEEVDALTRLLDSLLLLSKADDESVQLAKRTQPIVEVVQQAEEVMTVLAEQNDQTITIAGNDGIEGLIDETVFRLAVINLLDNAIKHGPRESEIEVRTVESDGCVHIDVHNDGAGIAEEHRERIFDRFYRVDTGRSRTAGGTGLGLAVARWAVEVHGGTLSVVDDGRPGATFRIRLPAATRAQP